MKALFAFHSADRRFGVALPAAVVNDMLGHARAAGQAETGGVLIGFYNDHHDTAVVARADGPAPDSHASRHRFWRGVQGLAETLAQRWSRPMRTYYLGEWHYHPFAAPDRSLLDDDTMTDPALRGSFHCDVPVLVILGGDPHGTWTLRAWAYPPSGHVPLAELPLELQGEST